IQDEVKLNWLTTDIALRESKSAYMAGYSFQDLKQDENVIVNQNGVSVGGDHNGLEEEYFGDEEAGANDHKKMIYWMLSKMTTAILKFRKIWAMITEDGQVTLLRIHHEHRRGLHDLAKSTFLYDTSLEYDLDFVALLETNRKDFSNERLSMILILLETPQKKTMIGFNGNKKFLFPLGNTSIISIEQEIYWIQRSKATNPESNHFSLNEEQFSKWNIISLLGHHQNRPNGAIYGIP
ncbi:hypothetical protein ACJX0J_019734, partial [Zea mays]